MVDVSDFPSNSNDQIVFAAKTLGRSKQRRKVFLAIYTGKKTKTVVELMKLTNMSRVRVLQETGKLSDIIEQKRIGKENSFSRIPRFMRHRDEILRFAGNNQAIAKIATKTNPKINSVCMNVSLSIPKKLVNIQQITIDEIPSFEKIKEIHQPLQNIPVLEKMVKMGIKRIINEPGDFQDWGGETDDLFSTRLILNGQRKTVAFGLKGRAMTGELTPKKMGKNGDQIQRLFGAPAEVFIVQYWGNINESVIEQMKTYAICKSIAEGRKIYYGIIDGLDTARLISAYPDFF